MKKKILNTCIAATLLGLASVNSQAASISFNETVVIPPPNVFGLDLLIDFSDIATTGGAVDLTWDSSVIQYNNDFAFNPTFTSRDEGFDVIDFQAPGLLSVGFGTLGTPIGDAIVAGTLGFTYVGGATNISLQDSIKWSGFFDATGALIPVNYTGATVNAVPIPAALWLMISGLGVLGFSAKRSKFI